MRNTDALDLSDPSSLTLSGLGDSCQKFIESNGINKLCKNLISLAIYHQHLLLVRCVHLCMLLFVIEVSFHSIFPLFMTLLPDHVVWPDVTRRIGKVSQRKHQHTS